ncbi:MAG: AraC family transcriptional regulator [Lachnospiraceae bacterium]|nr:AraC family transcriptional regulator [Lachnospiraceae bacterium]
MEKKGSYLVSKASLDMMERGYHLTYYDTGTNQTGFVHYHDYYEVIVYMGEDVLYQLEGSEYTVRRGDVILCRMFENHVLECRDNEHHQRLSLGIDARNLQETSVHDVNLLRIFSQDNSNYPILHLEMEQLTDYVQVLERYRKIQRSAGAEKPVLEKSLVACILGYLFRDCCKGLDSGQNADPRAEKVAKILEYVEENLEKDLMLESISAEFNYSVSHICRLFREVTGNTLASYITEKRISLARQLLYGDMPIMEVARLSGFHNYSNFYKTFKKSMGIGPEAYRNEQIRNQNSKI